LALGGLQFDRPLINGRTINIGDEILLRGVFRARAFEVTDFVKAPKDPFGGRMSDLLVQGFVASNASGLNYVAGHNWTLPEGLAPRFSGEELPAALFRGRWLSDDMSISPQPRIQIPGLLRNLPWALDGERFQAGDIPDLLRGQMEARGRDPLTIDPTTLPNIEQVRALVAAKGRPTGFLNAARPLTADQLSVLMEMGGADGTAHGIQRFDPERFGLFLERHEAIGELIEEGEFDSAQMPQLQAIKMRLQEAGVDPAQFIGARHELAAVVGLLRLRHAVKHEGFDPKSLPLATRARLRDLLTDRGVLPAQLPAAVRVAPAP